jgi:hypothetical protein
MNQPVARLDLDVGNPANFVKVADLQKHTVRARQFRDEDWIADDNQLIGAAQSRKLLFSLDVRLIEVLA